MKGHRQSCKFHDFLDISDIIGEETQQQALPRNKWRTVWGKLGSEKMLATKGWAKTTGCIWWARQRRSRWCRGRTGSPTPPSPGATSPPPARSPTLWAQWARWVKSSQQKISWSTCSIDPFPNSSYSRWAVWQQSRWTLRLGPILRADWQTSERRRRDVSTGQDWRI